MWKRAQQEAHAREVGSGPDLTPDRPRLRVVPAARTLTEGLGPPSRTESLPTACHVVTSWVPTLLFLRQPGLLHVQAPPGHPCPAMGLGARGHQRRRGACVGSGAMFESPMPVLALAPCVRRPMPVLAPAPCVRALLSGSVTGGAEVQVCELTVQS